MYCVQKYYENGLFSGGGAKINFGVTYGETGEREKTVPSLFIPFFFYVQFGKYSSVTHSNREYQEHLEFYWKPPTNIIGNEIDVTFFATLAKTKNIYWIFQQSNTLPMNMEDVEDLPTTGITTGTTTGTITGTITGTTTGTTSVWNHYWNHYWNLYWNKYWKNYWKHNTVSNYLSGILYIVYYINISVI